jgi:glycosyltransferase involved in cell wall biosynthesis
MRRPLSPLPTAPRVGIYMTAYNHEDFVAEAIESVLDQRIPADRLQFLVINDGSTDGTREALAPYERHVRVIHQHNGGLRAAVNRGMEELDADVITSISGDDTWPAGRVEALLETMAENPTAGLVYSDLEMTNRDGTTFRPSFMEAYGLVPYTGRIAGPLLGRNFVSGIGCMQRGVLKPLVHPIPDTAAWEDYWWAWRIAGVADVAYLPRSTCRYRQHDNNISLGADGDRLISAWSEELRYRRWMLADVKPGAVAGHHALDGWFMFVQLIRDLQTGGADTKDLLPVSARQRDEAAQRHAASVVALQDGELDEAARLGVAALAADPFDESVIGYVHGLRRFVPEPVEPTLDTTRSFTIVADAGELRDRPEMIEEIGRRFGRDDDATLVIYGRGWDEARLNRTFAPIAAAIDTDVLAVTDPPMSRRALLDRADAVYGEYLVLPGDRPPRYGPHEASVLRADAEQARAGSGGRAARSGAR